MIHGTYDFRKEMLQIHRPDILDPDYIAKDNEVCVDGWNIVIAKGCGRVLLTGVQDLQDYLLTSLSASVAICRKADFDRSLSIYRVVATNGN